MDSSSRAIREAFLQYFASQGHERLPSGPLVPPNDPTLMFANAGMVQFKDVFTGKDARPYSRATTSQKCIRISGKHNDLENVGVTARHHTFFEMLGNFSFGDYFKEDAIKFAWGFFMDVLKLDPERMVVTVFGGEEGYGAADEEAERIWRDVTGYPPERIIREGAKDNFWQMGDTGPCGPCTEIHYSLGTDTVDPRKFGEEPTPDGRGWFELWNLVFMQFDRQEDKTLKPLPAPSVDTGAGLERVAVVKQEQLSNYDTDLLRPLVELAGEIAGKKYTKSQSEDDISMRVIADHARTTAFCLSEGIQPDKDGRAYVIRRVMRRAIRHGHRLGIQEPFLHNVALKVVDEMGDAYPQLREQRDFIEKFTEEEEKRFRRTLSRGLDLISENEEWEREGTLRILPGPVAFKLYDTFGFPLDLQEVVGREEGFEVDKEGFQRELDAAKERSSGSKVGNAAVEDVYRPILEQLPEGGVHFVGYDTESAESAVVALLQNGKRVDTISAEKPDGEDYPEQEIVTFATPFYGEKGGQVGDEGVITFKNGDGADVIFLVEDTQIPLEGLYVHRGYLESGAISVGDEVTLGVSHAKRSATRRNHSATHLLHWALREVVGSTVAQKGSLVGPDRLRFDYSATAPLTPEQIREVEDLVNQAIFENTPITTEELAMDAAKQKGAIGIFEEKYGDVVRVLQIGPSLELCGGTHAARTGDIGMFTLLSEGGLAAGVRRIEAATGFGSLTHLRQVRTELEDTAGLLRVPVAETKERVEKLLGQQKELRHEIEKLQKDLLSGGGGQDLSAGAKEVDGVKVLGVEVPVGDGNALRELADQLRDKLAPAVVLIGGPSKDGKKAVLVCSVSKEVTKRFRAGDLVKRAAQVVGGNGGGRPDFAQAGGTDPSKLAEAVATVYEATGAA